MHPLYATIFLVSSSLNAVEILHAPLFEPTSIHKPHCCPNRRSSARQWASRGRISKRYSVTSQRSFTTIRRSRFVKPPMKRFCASIRRPTFSSCSYGCRYSTIATSEIEPRMYRDGSTVCRDIVTASAACSQLSMRCRVVPLSVSTVSALAAITPIQYWGHGYLYPPSTCRRGALCASTRISARAHCRLGSPSR